MQRKFEEVFVLYQSLFTLSPSGDAYSVDYGDSVCGDRVSFTDSNDVSDWRLSGHLTTLISDVIRLRVLFTLGINIQTSIMFVIYNVQGPIQREPQSFGIPKG